MSADEPQTISEIEVDLDNLYREEIVTDLRVASIRQLVPIKADGTRDESRQVLFTGQTTLMSQAGPLPVQAPIEAASLAEAAQKFPEAIKRAVERLMDEAREIQRREASRIVTPGEVAIPSLRGPGDVKGGGGIIG